MGEVVSYTKSGIDTIIDSVITNAEITGNSLFITKGDGSQIEIPLPPAEVSQAELDAAISGIIDSAPGTLNTLNEIATALGDDPNFATSIVSSIAAKIDLTQKAQASGVATLDEEAKLPMNQLNLTNIMGVVNHGEDGNAARPAGFSVVNWIGTAEPVNAIDPDIWTPA